MVRWAGTDALGIVRPKAGLDVPPWTQSIDSKVGLCIVNSLADSADDDDGMFAFCVYAGFGIGHGGFFLGLRCESQIKYASLLTCDLIWRRVFLALRFSHTSLSRWSRYCCVCAFYTASQPLNSN
jgi:hypothetical protein